MGGLFGGIPALTNDELSIIGGIGVRGRKVGWRVGPSFPGFVVCSIFFCGIRRSVSWWLGWAWVGGSADSGLADWGLGARHLIDAWRNVRIAHTLAWAHKRRHARPPPHAHAHAHTHTHTHRMCSFFAHMGTESIDAHHQCDGELRGVIVAVLKCADDLG